MLIRIVFLFVYVFYIDRQNILFMSKNPLALVVFSLRPSFNSPNPFLLIPIVPAMTSRNNLDHFRKGKKAYPDRNDEYSNESLINRSRKTIRIRPAALPDRPPVPRNIATSSDSLYNSYVTAKESTGSRKVQVFTPGHQVRRSGPTASLRFSRRDTGKVRNRPRDLPVTLFHGKGPVGDATATPIALRPFPVSLQYFLFRVRPGAIFSSIP